ncbi:winged helix-turn-helix domain-containing protein [Roseimicrobium sp. ORNL1]|uniref:winged helix-turn-helix domain-containing protein n=1 Tax=Roseimicrobium sp. ORNL1 TaxID=2711231 RepID=UPI00197F2896|nr:winged helix-turn-helix domain-containing protein [Roseimicrobium sp. ORNL1]
MAATKKSASGTGKPRVFPRFRMYRGNDLVLGPGKAELLAHIAETGSISEAARRMEMSYNRAWLHVKTMNAGFREPLVSSSRGGSEKGGATLTETGEQVLKLYRQMEQEASRAIEKTQQKLAGLLKA